VRVWSALCTRAAGRFAAQSYAAKGRAARLVRSVWLRLEPELAAVEQRAVRLVPVAVAVPDAPEAGRPGQPAIARQVAALGPHTSGALAW